MAELIEVLDDSAGEVECFLDPDNEVFFGPITEKEIEVRKPLPRRTLHPCEITEISKRGMSFHEWEEFKESVHGNQLNDEAICEVFGKDDTTESFASCCTSGEGELKTGGAALASDSDESLSDQSHSQFTSNESNPNEISGVESLNDTWEIQERMLAYAERLERGEDIPELGICNSINKTENSIRPFQTDKVEIKQEVHAYPDVSTDSWIIVNGKKETTDLEDEKENMSENSMQLFRKNKTAYEITHEHAVASTVIKKEPTEKSPTEPIGQLVNNTEALAVVQPNLLKSPAKCKSPSVRHPVKVFTPSRISFCETPIKTPRAANHRLMITPTHTDSSSKPGSSIKQLSCMKQNQHYGTPSPVGMYIRSLPEPILIENIRSSQKKKQIANVPCGAPTLIAVKKEDGRWGTMEGLTKATCSPPQPISIPEDYKPVLPVVLHEAAATIINETHSTTSLPGTTGKIGQLLKRGVTPTVLKHQGRIQLPNSGSRPSRIMEPPKSVKNERTRPDVLEVSVLETVPTPTNYRPVRLVKSARK